MDNVDLFSLLLLLLLSFLFRLFQYGIIQWKSVSVLWEYFEHFFFFSFYFILNKIFWKRRDSYRNISNVSFSFHFILFHNGKRQHTVRIFQNFLFYFILFILYGIFWWKSENVLWGNISKSFFFVVLFHLYYMEFFNGKVRESILL